MHRKRAVWQSKKKKSALLERDYLFFILSRARDIHTHAQFYRAVVLLSPAYTSGTNERRRKRQKERVVEAFFFFGGFVRVRESRRERLSAIFPNGFVVHKCAVGEIELKDNGRFREKGRRRRRRRRLETHALSLSFFLSICRLLDEEANRSAARRLRPLEDDANTNHNKKERKRRIWDLPLLRLLAVAKREKKNRRRHHRGSRGDDERKIRRRRRRLRLLRELRRRQEGRRLRILLPRIILPWTETFERGWTKYSTV